MKLPGEQDVHEHNRRVLRELQFDSVRWLSVQHAIRALMLMFEPALQAAIKLHEQMRSGALAWATRRARFRDGIQTSHVITRYPAPEDLDAVAPESLIAGMRDISEGDNTVVRYWDFVDLQLFNRWLSVLAEHARLRTAEKPKPGRIIWDDWWEHERTRYIQGLLPAEKGYLTEVEPLIRERYGIKGELPMSELRRLKAALYRGDTERPKRTRSAKRKTKKRKMPSD